MLKDLVLPAVARPTMVLSLQCGATQSAVRDGRTTGAAASAEFSVLCFSEVCSSVSVSVASTVPLV